MNNWSTAQDRGGLLALAYSGMAVSNMATYPIAGFLCEYAGWQWIFYSAGIFTLFNHSCSLITRVFHRYWWFHLVPSRIVLNLRHTFATRTYKCRGNTVPTVWTQKWNSIESKSHDKSTVAILRVMKCWTCSVPYHGARFSLRFQSGRLWSLTFVFSQSAKASC